MEKASKELLREFVNSQHFTSTTEIMNSMKERKRQKNQHLSLIPQSMVE